MCLQEDQEFGFKHVDVLYLRGVLGIQGTCSIKSVCITVSVPTADWPGMAPSWSSSASPPSALYCEGLFPLPAPSPGHCCGQLPFGHLHPAGHQCGCSTDHAQGEVQSSGDGMACYCTTYKSQSPSLFSLPVACQWIEIWILSQKSRSLQLSLEGYSDEPLGQLLSLYTFANWVWCC